jgi:hypothetical protein
MIFFSFSALNQLTFRTPLSYRTAKKKKKLQAKITGGAGGQLPQ